MSHEHTMQTMPVNEQLTFPFKTFMLEWGNVRVCVSDICHRVVIGVGQSQSTWALYQALLNRQAHGCNHMTTQHRREGMADNDV